MANPEHLAKLKEGVEAWNEWRSSSGKAAFDSGFSSAFQTSPDLSGADLTGMQIPRINLSDVDLSGANLSDANLSGADLSRADLSQALLRNTNLPRVNFSRANLTEARLNSAHCPRARMSNTILVRADCTNAHFELSSFLGANLFEAALHRTNLIRTTFSGAALAYANFSGADLSNSNLAESNARYVDEDGLRYGAASGLTQNQIDLAYGNAATVLPAGLSHPDHWATGDSDYASSELVIEGGTADLTIVPSIPVQSAAPLEVRWDGDLLVPSDRAIPVSSTSNLRGQEANFNKIRELLRNLEDDNRGANAAPEVGEAIAAYSSALGGSLETLHSFNVGFAGLIVADATKAASEDLPEGYRGKVRALLTLNDHLLAQDPEWTEYVSKLRTLKISLAADEEVEASANEVISALENATEIIAPLVATRLRTLRRLANQVRQSDKRILKPLWDSFENTVRALGARVVEAYGSRSREFSEAVGILQDELGPMLEDAWQEGKQVGKTAGRRVADFSKNAAKDLGRETYKRLIQFGGAGGALYILWIAHPHLLKISQTLGFTWLENLLNFVRTVSGG